MNNDTSNKPGSKPISDKINYGVLEESLGYIVRRAQLKIFHEFKLFFEALDIKPAQFSVLEIIHNNPGLRQSALARALNIQRTNMVGMLDQLQKRELIERKPSPQDLRAHALHLTRKGEKLLSHLHQQFHQHEDLLRERLGDDNFRLVRENLQIIISSPEPSEY